MSNPLTFRITSGKLTDRGTRLLPEGAVVERFQKNPIMLWMHKRDNGWDNSPSLPIGHWENLRLQDGAWLADAKFDQDDFAQTIKEKVDAGTLKACSPGVSIIELSEDPKHLVIGQTRPTISKWELLEVSICDIPADSDAVRLYSQNAMNLAYDAELPLLSTINLNKMPENVQENSFESLKKWLRETFGLTPKAEQTAAELEETKQQVFAIKENFEKLSGRFTAIEKENAELKAENQTLKTDVETLRKAPGADSTKAVKATDGAAEKSAIFSQVTRAREIMNACGWVV